MTPFTNTGGTTHKLTGFTIPSVGRNYDFFVDCSRGSDQRKFTLSADTNNPNIINASANPDSILQLPFQTTIRVTTDEPTSCKYDQNEEDYEAMSNFFSGNDRSRSNYRTEHEATITGLTDETNYAYRVKCKDLTARFSETTKLKFTVNTKTDPTISNISPQARSYHNSGNVLLSIRTNKDSTCNFGNSSDRITRTGGSFSVFRNRTRSRDRS